MFSPVITQLIERLSCLPGVGRKSAQRMAMHLLEHDRQGGLALAEGLEEALTKVKNCTSCRNLTENSQCHICSDLQRVTTELCIVESPSDVIAIEHSGSFRGYYFVLMGHLSPMMESVLMSWVLMHCLIVFLLVSKRLFWQLILL